MSKKLKKGKTRTVGVFLRNLPSDLRDQFKACCARRGRNMTEIVTEFIRTYVKKGGEE